MSVMKKVENEVPFKSGCDDADATELQLGLEELLELHLTASSSAAANSNRALAATKATNKRAASMTAAPFNMVAMRIS